MSKERIRIGMIGCGQFAQRHHIKDILDIPEAEIVALADASQESLTTTVTTFPTLAGVPQFHDYKAMIDQVPLDGVVIVSPHTLHFEQTAYALEHNVSALVEMGEMPSGFDEGMQFWLEGGRISIQGIDQPKLTIYDPEPRLIPTEPRVDLADRDRNFVRALLGLETVQVTAECGLRIAELSEAIYESSRTGQPVRVQTGE